MSMQEKARAKGYGEGYQAARRAEANRADAEPLTLDDVKAMTKDQINERWDEVEQVLSAPTPQPQEADDDDA